MGKTEAGVNGGACKEVGGCPGDFRCKLKHEFIRSSSQEGWRRIAMVNTICDVM